jgi:ectoine hydroxylase-related dioxygenase (phytanoyl-CoA dioxygenase family)
VTEAYAVSDAEGALAAFERDGYVLLRGVHDEAEMDALTVEMERLQSEVRTGALDDQHRDVVLGDSATEAEVEHVNYVYYATRHSDLADRIVHTDAVVGLVRALLGSDTWLLDYERFGVVYQDSRPGAESAYSRIGWHTDRQSGPHLAVWPSIAFTVHLDGTSPANGFLRVVPGSHRRTTDGLPPAFEPVEGEVAVYARRGDVLLHHCDLWHSAARATEDPPGGVRRHLRGGWYTGEPLAAGHGVADFVKNAQR